LYHRNGGNSAPVNPLQKMENITTTPATTAQKFEIWLLANNFSKDQLEYCAARGFDPQTVTNNCHPFLAVSLAQKLNLSQSCIQLAMDFIAVIVHKNTDPRAKTLLSAAQKFIDAPTLPNIKALKELNYPAIVPVGLAVNCLVFALTCFFRGADLSENLSKSLSFSGRATAGEVDLVEKMKAFLSVFSANVYNSLITELEK